MSVVALAVPLAPSMGEHTRPLRQSCEPYPRLDMTVNADIGTPGSRARCPTRDLPLPSSLYTFSHRTRPRAFSRSSDRSWYGYSQAPFSHVTSSLRGAQCISPVMIIWRVARGDGFAQPGYGSRTGTSSGTSARGQRSTAMVFVRQDNDHNDVELGVISSGAGGDASSLSSSRMKASLAPSTEYDYVRR
jgi:hypothetical protein